MTVYIAGTNARVPICSVALQGIIYGFSVCMFGLTIWTLAFQRRLRGSVLMVSTACVLWALSTARMCIDINLTIRAFVYHINEGQLGPQQYLSTFSSTTSLTDNTIYGLQTLIGDAIVIYRCYVVWQSWWIIVFPCLTWLGALGSMCYILDMFASGVVSGQRGLIIYVFTFAANISATAALAYRIWKVDRDAACQTSSRSSLRPVAIVIIESGAIYTAILILALITAIHALEAEYVVNSIIPAVISATFNMVFIRIALARVPGASSSSSPKITVSSVLFNPRAFATSTKRTGSSANVSATPPVYIQDVSTERDGIDSV